jgi:hypothetical protein
MMSPPAIEFGLLLDSEAAAAMVKNPPKGIPEVGSERRNQRRTDREARGCARLPFRDDKNPRGIVKVKSTKGLCPEQHRRISSFSTFLL